MSCFLNIKLECPELELLGVLGLEEDGLEVGYPSEGRAGVDVPPSELRAAGIFVMIAEMRRERLESERIANGMGVHGIKQVDGR